MSDRKATDDQIIEALKLHTMPKAAEHLGIHIRTLRKRKSALARKGWSPEHDLTHAVPDGFHLKGASTLYKDGVQVMQWVKSSIDHERQRELMIAACQAMSEDLPQIDPVSGPISTLANLMAVYPIGDAHIGMRAWGRRRRAIAGT